MSVWDITTKEIARPVKIPPILTPRECEDSWITCRVCWNGIQATGLVYINNGKTAELVICPECNGTRQMRSVTKEENFQLRKQLKDENIPRPSWK